MIENSSRTDIIIASDAKSLEEAYAMLGISNADVSLLTSADQIPTSFSEASMDGFFMCGQGARTYVSYEGPEGILILSKRWINTDEKQDSGESFFLLQEPNPEIRFGITAQIEKQNQAVSEQETDMLQDAHSTHSYARVQAALEELRLIMARELTHWFTPPQDRN